MSYVIVFMSIISIVALYDIGFELNGPLDKLPSWLIGPFILVLILVGILKVWKSGAPHKSKSDK
jgi:hypothetical protein